MQLYAMIVLATEDTALLKQLERELHSTLQFKHTDFVRLYCQETAS